MYKYFIYYSTFYLLFSCSISYTADAHNVEIFLIFVVLFLYKQCICFVDQRDIINVVFTDLLAVVGGVYIHN